MKRLEVIVFHCIPTIMNRRTLHYLFALFLLVSLLFISPGVSSPLQNLSKDQQLKHHNSISINETSIHGLQVVVLNLDHHMDRFRYMQYQLHLRGIKFTRFPGIDFHSGDPVKGAKTQHLLHPKTAFNFEKARNPITKDRWEEVGSWQSHLQVYFNYIDGKLGADNDPLLILEDNITLKPVFDAYLSPDFFSSLPSDWEMLFLDFSAVVCHAQPKANHKWHHWFQTLKMQSSSGEHEFCLIKHIEDAGAYIIRSAAVANKLIVAINQHEPAMTDNYLNLQLLPNKEIKAYSVVTSPTNDNGQFESSVVNFRVVLGKLQHVYDSINREQQNSPTSFYLRRAGY